jgi:hypothetical protein
MTFTCPNCGSKVAPYRLRVDWGSAGRMECPECGIGLRYSPPYDLIILWGSFPFLCFFLVTKGIQGGLFFSAKLVLTWFFGSMLFSALLGRVRPPKLKLACPKDKDGPIQLFGKRRQ